MRYALAGQGVFRSYQGEGCLLGTPMAFVRLAGCSVGCPECDTDYAVSDRREAGEILQAVSRCVGPAGWVWLTGGEPTDQPAVGEELAPLLRRHGYRVALATSGVRRVSAESYDWVSVSPHSLLCRQTTGDEVKLTLGLNGLSPATAAALDTTGFAARWVTPCDGDAASLRACLDWVERHPDWRLGCQAHKWWNLP